MNRDPNGYDCTRDPVYLGQWRELNVIAWPEWCEIIDCESVKVSRDHYDVPDGVLEKLDTDDTVSWSWLSKHLADSGCDSVIESWHTECVFLTRAEGEAWMKARSHRWGYGWRVYCVCAEGELARVLNELPEPAKEPA